MSEFVTTLREQVRETQRALTAAQAARHPHEVRLHLARLRDLLEIAERHAVDTRDWVHPSVRQILESEAS
ncbi:hypothetical protein F0L68_40140 [Solihabitans fulvus]|uniref:Uncharacterized protein n=1 Tax=Solihabitans fulvus TaxID=1892852 RepID=A0A5B2W9U0_9PSEU|nr:hypothetical protein [Solihabitans fulvus]KAA2247316.1 hypothetical protein F0L68_40140 [Solihabitans fulvus]